MNTSNDCLSMFLIIAISILIYQEKYFKICFIVVGITIISYSFTKNITFSLLLALLLSYCLIVLFYKNYKKIVFEKITNKKI